MKVRKTNCKEFICLMAVLIFISCEMDKTQVNDISANHHRINKELAIRIANASFNADNSAKKSSEENRLNYEITEVHPIEDENGLVSMYAINFEPKAFIIVSAHLLDVPVLAFSSDRNFDHITARINAGVSDWINHNIERINNLDTEADTNLDTEADSQSLSYIEGMNLMMGSTAQNLETSVENVLLTSSWGQGCPYNKDLEGNCNVYGENYVTGCVATAAAQVMYFWKKPAVYDFGSMEDGYNPFKMDGWMCHHPQDNMPKLFKDIGAGVEMDYGCDESSSYISKIPGYWRSINEYSSAQYINSFDKNIAISELDQGRPIIVAGNFNHDSDDRHAWVIDGHTYVRPNDYFHMNWGWDGAHNGTYIVTSSNGQYESTDFTISSMVYNIHPN